MEYWRVLSVKEKDPVTRASLTFIARSLQKLYCRNDGHLTSSPTADQNPR